MWGWGGWAMGRSLWFCGTSDSPLPFPVQRAVSVERADPGAHLALALCAVLVFSNRTVCASRIEARDFESSNVVWTTGTERVQKSSAQWGCETCLQSEQQCVHGARRPKARPMRPARCRWRGTRHVGIAVWASHVPTAAPSLTGPHLFVVALGGHSCSNIIVNHPRCHPLILILAK